MTLVLAPVARTRPVEPRRRPLPEPAAPFTLAHFRAWASDLILDTGESWHPEPFQDAFIEDVFTGCPECWLVVPEGNGKTTLVAGLALYHCEHRPHASVPVAASSREQAEIMYRQAEGFVLRSERLYQPVHSQIQQAKGKKKTDVPRFVTLEGYRRINHYQGGRIQVFAADDRTGDGVIPTLGILDELHRHRDLALYRTWAGKLAKRGGQIVAISTAGEPGSEFEQTRERIRQRATHVYRTGSHVRAVSTRMVLHEWAVPPKTDPDDFKAVKAANPFSGLTVPMLRSKYRSPTMTMQHWLRFVCNRPTRAENAAIQEAEWRRAATKDRIPKGEPIWLGLDVAWKWDTTAAVPFWMRDPKYRLFGPATVLVPPRDGTSLDPSLVERALVQIHERNPIHTLVMDTSRAEQLAQWAESEFGCVVVDRPQTNTFAVQDYERFMDALRNGWLLHSGDAELTAHAQNAIARVLPHGDARFDRPSQTRQSAEQERRVIDALTAAAMVHSQAVAGLSEGAAAEVLMAWG
ncbi:MAG TPA: terminase large subunit [Solirubrobacteraceae bacterium]